MKGLFLSDAKQFILKLELSRTGKSILTYISSFLMLMAQNITSFITTPIIVAGLGSELYGAMQMIYQTISYVSITDFRPINALKHTLSTLQDKPDEEKQEQVGAAILAWLILIPVFLILGVVAVVLSPRFIVISSGESYLVQLGMAIAVLNLIISNIVALPNTVLISMNLAYKRMGLNAFISVITGLLGVAAVKLGLSLPGVIASVFASNLIQGAVNFYIARRYITWFGWKRPQWQMAKGFISFSIWVTISSFATLFLFQTDVLLVGIVTTPVVVAAYFITKRAMDWLTLPILNLVSATRASIGEIMGRGEWENLVQIRQEFLAILIAYMTVISGVVIVINRSFVTLWVSQDQYAGNAINMILVLASLQPAFSHFDGMVIDLSRNIRGKTIYSLIAGAIAVASGLLLSLAFQEAGVIAGVLIGKIFYTIFMIHVTGKIMKVRSTTLIMPFIRSLVVYLIIVALGMFVNETLQVTSWLQIVLVSAAAGLVAFILAWWLGTAKAVRLKVVKRFALRPVWVRNLLVL